MTIFPNTCTRMCGRGLGPNIARSGPISIGSVRGLRDTRLQNFRSIARDLRPAVCPIAKSEKCRKIAKRGHSPFSDPTGFQSALTGPRKVKRAKISASQVERLRRYCESKYLHENHNQIFFMS